MKNLLIAQDLRSSMLGAVRFLHRSDIKVHPAASNEELLRLHLELNANLIATHPALPGMACADLFGLIRRGETLKHVSILLLCDPTPLHQELARRCGANTVLTLPVDTALLADTVRQLLDVPPRRAYRVVLNIAAEGVYENRPFLCHTENISAGGMLIKAREPLAPGNEISCSFYLPGGTRVNATGRVVRADRKDAGADMMRYGISFLRLPAETAAAIAAFADEGRPAERPFAH